MKTFRLVRNSAMALIVAMSMTACHDDDDEPEWVEPDPEPEIQDPEPEPEPDNNDLTIDFQSTDLSFNDEDYWSDCYNTEVVGVTFDGVTFTHEASASEWDGVVYYSWMGFCPSKSTDTTEYSADELSLHQWSSITGGGVSSSTYVVGMWDVYEEENPEAPILSITYGGATFEPKTIYVTNNTYAYYAMKNGSYYNHQFGDDDYFTLHILGSLDGVTISSIDVSLATGTNLLDTWEEVDLSTLGVVDMIYFQMTSSDTGQWGMNNPAMFCIGQLTIGI